MKERTRSKRMRSALAVALSVLLASQSLGLTATKAIADELAADDGLVVVAEAPEAKKADDGLASADASADAPEATGVEVSSDVDGGDVPVGGMDATAVTDAQEEERQGEPKIDAVDADKSEVIHYLDAGGEDATVAVSDCTNVNDVVKDGRFWLTSGWYYVKGWCHQLGRGEIRGDVHIILCDGGTFEQFKGFHVAEGSKLSVYWQQGKKGKLIAGWAHEDGCAGIGGNDGENSGEIYIYGGNIEADGGEDGAGIGGGRHGKCTLFEMFGGNVVAKALSYEPYYYGIDMKCKLMQLPGGGAGVGSGADATSGKIYIHGGKLTATGGSYFKDQGGAGIGAGGSGGTGIIEIDGGEVSATGGPSAAGIGSSLNRDCGTITISNAKVTAQGGKFGAGIGGGEGGAGGHIFITDAEVSATGIAGAGIGGGCSADGGSCTIEGGSVTATSKTVNSEFASNVSQGAAIGAGAWSKCGGTVTIDGGARVSCSVDNMDKHASCIGSGRVSDGIEYAQVKLYESASVSSAGERMPVAERTKVLAEDTQVNIEPCPHEQVEYTATPAGHHARCLHCDAFKDDETYAHEFGEDDCCKQCGYERPRPRFVDATLTSDGSLGLVFWLEARDYGAFDYRGDTVKLSVGGKKAHTLSYRIDECPRSADGYYGVFMPLSSLEMAEKVSARYAYGDGKSVEMEACLSDMLKDYGDGVRGTHQAKTAARALANYGHYLQLWSSREKGWKLGADYAACELCYPELCDVSSALAKTSGYVCSYEARSADGEAARAAEDAACVKASSRLDSRVSLDVTVTPRVAGAENFRCSCDESSGTEASGELREDGSYHVCLDNLVPQHFGTPVSISFDCAGTTYTVDVSLLSYIHAMLESDDVAADTKQAMAAVYWVYTQAGAYESMSR